MTQARFVGEGAGASLASAEATSGEAERAQVNAADVSNRWSMDPPFTPAFLAAGRGPSSRLAACCASGWVGGRPVRADGPASSRLLFGLDQLAIDQQFGDLDRIQRRALAQIVGDAPEHKPVLDSWILTDS